MRSSYDQLRIQKEDIPKTTIRTRYGLYKFLVFLFGLKNVLAAFMDLINQNFKLYLDKFMVVFIDYILVYLKSHEDYEKHLATMLQTLRENQFYAKLSKCEF